MHILGASGLLAWLLFWWLFHVNEQSEARDRARWIQSEIDRRMKR